MHVRHTCKKSKRKRKIFEWEITELLSHYSVVYTITRGQGIYSTWKQNAAPLRALAVSLSLTYSSPWPCGWHVWWRRHRSRRRSERRRETRKVRLLLASSFPPEGVGGQLNNGRDECPFDSLFPLPREQCALLSFFLVHPRLGCWLGTRLNRTTIDRPTDTRVERHFNERAAAL